MRFLQIFLLFLFSDHSTATTEQIKRWIIANKHAFPKEAQDAISNASGSEIATALLRMFGFKSTSHRTSITAASSIGAKITTEATGSPMRRSVCPFDAPPLLVLNEYAYCKPSQPDDCPSGYVCDQSFVLGRSICCKEGIGRETANKNASTFRTVNTQWKTIKPPRTPQDLIVVGQPLLTTTKKTPWYIKINDRNPWNIRVTPSVARITPITAPPPFGQATSTQSSPNSWARLWSTTATPFNVVNVTVLQTGSKTKLKDNQQEVIGAITLINDNGLHVLVDTGAASETEVLLRGLADNQVSLDEIDVVVITHGHPGHMGNLNFFGQKPVLYHFNEYIGHHVSPTELTERPYRKLTANIEVWKTAGHTQHDLSVLVHNVPSYGTMAIVGDLIPAESLLSERVDPVAEEGVWDSSIKRQNANLLICMADWVVPGHGPPFRVLAQYRQRAGCAMSTKAKL
ncbi:Lactamase-B domain-containing protein [Aphelenchoides besseyi]|nr:Lactamase-B domain-containing protein [Aphelenchoides besseyi]KAI6211688.1 Lactamase-B domain-containing protein [Aphelenchoides besseyi]